MIDFNALHTQADRQLLQAAREPRRRYLDAREYFKFCRIYSLGHGVVQLRCPRRIRPHAQRYLGYFQDALSDTLGCSVFCVLLDTDSEGEDCPQHAQLPPKSPLGQYGQQLNLGN